MQTFPSVEQLTENGVHILDGIAGSAKTSRTVQLFQQNGIDYVHTTSTHKLRRDIEHRFCHDAGTVAGTLFTTGRNGEYYNNFKPVSAHAVIIDEILQTDSRVFDWVGQFKKDHSIVICTDSHQMLSPKQGMACLDRLHDLENKADWYNPTISLRPIDDETKFLYSYGYGLKPEGTELFEKLRRAFTIEHTMPDYDNSNAYIFHSNLLEKSYYEYAGLYNRYDIELIPKGYIAAHPTHKTNYPILPQMDADGGKISSYYQAANCGSVLRFQGSEIMPGDNLYFIFSKSARVSNRECYTMITRMKSIKSLHLVQIDTERDIPQIETFAGKPVIHGWALRTDNAPGSLKPEEIAQRIETANATQNAVVYTSILDTSGNKMTGYENAEKTNHKTLWSMCRRQPSLALNRINLFYKTVDTVAPGCVPKAVTQQDFICHKIEPYSYFVDLVASYPHQWIQGMPDCTTYTPEIDADWDDSEYQQIYICTSELYDMGAIITDDLNTFMTENHAPGWYAEPIGCVKIAKFDRIGQYMMEQCYDTVESKTQFKQDFKWGWMLKPFLEPVQWDGEGHFKSFLINPDNRYILSIAFIHSRQMLVMSKLKQLIYGDQAHGETKVDALYFNYDGDMDELAARITETIPGYDFKIYKNDARKTANCTLFYSSCPPLPTKEEKRKLHDRERKARKKRG